MARADARARTRVSLPFSLSLSLFPLPPPLPLESSVCVLHRGKVLLSPGSSGVSPRDRSRGDRSLRFVTARYGRRRRRFLECRARS